MTVGPGGVVKSTPGTLAPTRAPQGDTDAGVVVIVVEDSGEQFT